MHQEAQADEQHHATAATITFHDWFSSVLIFMIYDF
jgi:hypothetical protein